MSLPDSLVAVGLVLLAAGLGLWSVPLMLAVLGVLFLLAGLWSHWSQKPDGDPRPPVPPPE